MSTRSNTERRIWLGGDAVSRAPPAAESTTVDVCDVDAAVPFGGIGDIEVHVIRCPLPQVYSKNRVVDMFG